VVMQQTVPVVVEMSTFGQWLAVQRRLHGLPQDAVASLLKVSKQTISSWENDHHTAVITTRQYNLLMRLFGTTPGQEPQVGLVVRPRNRTRQSATSNAAHTRSRS